LLLVTVVLTAAVGAAHDIALVVGVGITLVVIFADLQVGKYFP
jgi:hypothetical protein